MKNFKKYIITLSVLLSSWSAFGMQQGPVQFAAAVDNNIIIQELQQGMSCKTIQTLDKNAKVHTDSVYSLAYDHKTGRLFSGSFDKTIKIWVKDENNTYKCIQTKKESGRARALVILSDNNEDEQEELSQQDTKERIGFIFDDLAKPAEKSVLTHLNVNVRKPWVFLSTKQPEVLTRQEQVARNINVDEKQRKINKEINILTATQALLFN